MSTALISAVEACDLYRLKFLLNRGLRINTKDAQGENILVTALKMENNRKRYKMFQWLLSKGANIMTVSKTSGRDILIWASYLNRPTEVDLILNDIGGELDLRRKDYSGYTALHYATMYDCESTVLALCQYMSRYDISVDIIDGEGLTPYLLARRLNHASCAQILQNIGQACPYMGDNINRQSHHFWETVGDMERNRKNEQEKGRVIATYKLLGRLPQLKKAHYDADQVKIVPSITEQRVIEANLRPRRHGALQPLDMSILQSPDKAIASRIEAGQNDTKQQKSDAIIKSIHTFLETDSFTSEKPKLPPLDNDSEAKFASPRLMCCILDIMSEQSTHAFKHPARRPRARELNSLRGAATATAFGLRLKRRMNTTRGSRKTSRDHGQSGQTTTEIHKDHILVQS